MFKKLNDEAIFGNFKYNVMLNTIYPIIFIENKNHEPFSKIRIVVYMVFLNHTGHLYNSTWRQISVTYLLHTCTLVAANFMLLCSS